MPMRRKCSPRQSTHKDIETRLSAKADEGIAVYSASGICGDRDYQLCDHAMFDGYDLEVECSVCGDWYWENRIVSCTGGVCVGCDYENMLQYEIRHEYKTSFDYDDEGHSTQCSRKFTRVSAVKMIIALSEMQTG